MADYKELLRKAIEALPESNGAARRGVYEKARGALVNQLRAIKPPLAPRDINQHRLNLEDCIRLVEQEATEALLLGRARQPARLTAPEPEPASEPAPARGKRKKAAARPKSRAKPKSKSKTPPPTEPAYEAVRAVNAHGDGAGVTPAHEAPHEPEMEPAVEAAPPRPRSRTRTLGNHGDRPAAGRTAELAAAGNSFRARSEPVAPVEDDHALVPAPVAPRGRQRQTIEQVIAAAEREEGETGQKPRKRTRKAGKSTTKAGARSGPRRRKVRAVDDEFDPSALIDEINPAVAQRALARKAGAQTRPVVGRSSQREAAAMRQASRPVQNVGPGIVPEDLVPEELASEGMTPEKMMPEIEDHNDDPLVLAPDHGREAEIEDNPQAAIDRAIAALDREASGQAGYEDEGDALYEFGALSSGPERDDGVEAPPQRPESSRRNGRLAGRADDFEKHDETEPVDGSGSADDFDHDDDFEPEDDDFDHDDDFEPEDEDDGRGVGRDDGFADGLADLQPPAIASRVRRPARPRPEVNPIAATGGAPREGGARTKRKRDKRFATELADAPMLDDEQVGGNRLLVFLVLVAVLLVAVGGGAFWAWREGFLDFSAASPQPGTSASSAPVQIDANAGSPRTVGGGLAPAETVPGPDGNGGIKNAERLPAQTNVGTAATPNADTPAGELSVGAQVPIADETQRQVPATEALPEVASLTGSQSILFEEQSNGAGPAPFSGGVEWSRGVDEIGLPVIRGKSTIPARNLGVDILIRKNSDPALPASHLIEVNFSVTQSFVGGGIASLPGVLLKREERAQDDALVGASARVFDNSFLFALSSEPKDVATNTEMLATYEWLDLPLVYSTGRRAIVSLEKGEKGREIFDEVLKMWAEN
jgi:hypothetical protein